MHKFSINVVTQSGQRQMFFFHWLLATNIQAISLRSRLPASFLCTFKSRTLFNRGGCTSCHCTSMYHVRHACTCIVSYTNTLLIIFSDLSHSNKVVHTAVGRLLYMSSNPRWALVSLVAVELSSLSWHRIFTCSPQFNFSAI